MQIGSLIYYIIILLSSISILSFIVGSIVFLEGYSSYVSIYITSSISLFFAVILLVAFKDTKKTLDSRAKNIFLVIILWTSCKNLVYLLDLQRTQFICLNIIEKSIIWYPRIFLMLTLLTIAVYPFLCLMVFQIPSRIL